jgi:hypothetical protein
LAVELFTGGREDTFAFRDYYEVRRACHDPAAGCPTIAASRRLPSKPGYGPTLPAAAAVFNGGSISIEFKRKPQLGQVEERAPCQQMAVPPG